MPGGRASWACRLGVWWMARGDCRMAACGRRQARNAAAAPSLLVPTASPLPHPPSPPAVPREVGPPPGGPDLVRSRVPVVFFTPRGVPGESREPTDTVTAALRGLKLPGARRRGRVAGGVQLAAGQAQAALRESLGVRGEAALWLAPTLPAPPAAPQARRRACLQTAALRPRLRPAAPPRTKQSMPGCPPRTSNPLHRCGNPVAAVPGRAGGGRSTWQGCCGGQASRRPACGRPPGQAAMAAALGHLQTHHPALACPLALLRRRATSAALGSRL